MAQTFCGLDMKTVKETLRSYRNMNADNMANRRERINEIIEDLRTGETRSGFINRRLRIHEEEKLLRALEGIIFLQELPEPNLRKEMKKCTIEQLDGGVRLRLEGNSNIRIYNHNISIENAPCIADRNQNFLLATYLYNGYFSTALRMLENVKDHRSESSKREHKALRAVHLIWAGILVFYALSANLSFLIAAGGVFLLGYLNHIALREINERPN